MTRDKEIRWKQRFANYDRAFQLLERTVQLQTLTEIERGGLIQFFEMTFELAWKVMKDYLEAQGLIVQSPRAAIKQAIQYGLIENPHTWMDALDDRNLTVHTYDEETAMEIARKIIKDYFGLLKDLHSNLKSEIE